MVGSRWLRTAGALASTCFVLTAAAQPPAPPAASPRAAARADLTGHWVAQITEDWRWRMITPPKGDYASVPLTPLGREVADRWDPAADAAAGEACRAFGAGGLMRLPTRLKIAWADDATLRIETDAGMQVRMLHFDRASPAQRPPSWQGHSVAEWLGVPAPVNPFGGLAAPTQGVATARAGGGAGGPPSPGPLGGPPAAAPGSLKVVTTNLRAGYLRKNGVPYSDAAIVTEYYDRITMFGNDYLQVVTVVTDPMYLTTPFVVSNQFKREADDSKWNPTPCATAPPVGKFQAPIG